MIRAPIRLLRRICCAAVLLGLLLCGAEVGVRVVEVVQGRSVCSDAGGHVWSIRRT